MYFKYKLSLLYALLIVIIVVFLWGGGGEDDGMWSNGMMKVEWVFGIVCDLLLYEYWKVSNNKIKKM